MPAWRPRPTRWLPPSPDRGGPYRAGFWLICLLLPVLEAGVLWLTGLAGDRALATQVTSPGPWGQFHDLRWLLVFHYSWFGAALEAAAVLVGRSALDTVLVRLAWPSGPVPPFRSVVTGQTAFTLTAWVCLLPWTLLGFGMGVVPISWLFFTVVPPAFVVALACSRSGIGRGWWRHAPPGRAVTASAALFAAQTLLGLATTSAPAGLWLPLAAAGGAVNGWSWRRVVTAVADDHPRRNIPVPPLVSVGMLTVAVSGAAIAFAVVGHRRTPAGRPVAEPVSGPDRPVVLVVSGFDSKLGPGTPAPPLHTGREVRFSYRGADRRGEPLPYSAADTHGSIAQLADRMTRQISALHRTTGQPVAIVAESEGSLIAEVYLAAHADAPVPQVILLSPLMQPARVYYPPAGRSGFGQFSGTALQWLTDLIGGISPVHLSADDPLLRSIDDHAFELRGLLRCPAPVPETVLEPLADALAGPPTVRPSATTVVLPAFHGGLLTNRRAQTDIDRLLAGEAVHGPTGLGTLWYGLRGAAAAWQLPTIPLAVYGSSPDRPSCTSIRAGIRSWVDGPS